MKKLLVIFYLAYFHFSYCQTWNAKDSLLFFGDIMLNTSMANHRIWAAEQFDVLFQKQIKNNPFINLPLKGNICQAFPADSSFCLYTWEIAKENGESMYYGYVAHKTGSIKKLHFKYREITKTYFEPIYPSNWYGALYFHFLPDQIREGVYTLFGFRQHKNLKYKIIETLTFEKDVPVFGVEVFTKIDSTNPDKIQRRVVVPFSPSAFCNITYNETDKQIVYDHIIPVINPRESGEIQYLPDGSYEAFEKVGNNWQYIDKLPTTAVSEPPREHPVLDEKNKDILGRTPKKSKKK